MKGKVDDWQIVITPNGDTVAVSFSATTDEAAADARRAFAELTVSGIPDDLVQGTTVNHRGVPLSMDAFLILAGTEKLYMEFRKSGLDNAADELRREVEEHQQTAEEALNDPAVQEYLRVHPEEMEQIKRAKAMGSGNDSDV